MPELDSPETHIYISTRGYRERKNSACEIEILEGTLRQKREDIETIIECISDVMTENVYLYSFKPSFVEWKV